MPLATHTHTQNTYSPLPVEITLVKESRGLETEYKRIALIFQSSNQHDPKHTKSGPWTPMRARLGALPPPWAIFPRFPRLAATLASWDLGYRQQGDKEMVFHSENNKHQEISSSLQCWRDHITGGSLLKCQTASHPALSCVTCWNRWDTLKPSPGFVLDCASLKNFFFYRSGASLNIPHTTPFPHYNKKNWYDPHQLCWDANMLLLITGWGWTDGQIDGNGN